MVDDPPAVDIDFVIRNPPPLHEGHLYALAIPAVNALQKRLKAGMRTLETGCGLSTFAFAFARTDHTTITPSQKEADLFAAYCSTHAIPTDRIRMVVGSSHLALPREEPNTFDLILIDGCHGIPMVQVDYLFSALLLRPGGILILDDIQISPVRDLLDFLRTEPSWRIDEISGATAFLTKLRNGEEIREWSDQPYVVADTRFFTPMDKLKRIGRAAAMFARGDFRRVWAKLRSR